MKEYTLFYKDGKIEAVFFPDKKSLIEDHFNGSIDQFKADVTRLRWETLSMRYDEDVLTGKINAEMTTADAILK